MIIGMTGSRDGMTAEAKAAFLEWLAANEVTEAHHGDCIGADAAFHDIMTARGIAVIIHPPTDSKMRAFCDSPRTLAALPYLKRNHAIVDACDLLVAFPIGPEVQRSGTWATIRYARKQGKTVVIF